MAPTVIVADPALFVAPTAPPTKPSRAGGWSTTETVEGARPNAGRELSWARRLVRVSELVTGTVVKIGWWRRWMARVCGPREVT